MLAERRLPAVSTLLLPLVLLAGCASGPPPLRVVKSPIRETGVGAVLDAAAEALLPQFPVQRRDDKAGRIVTEEVIRNTVLGTLLDRYRRKAHLEAVRENGAVRIRILVTLEKASPGRPLLYMGPRRTSWKGMGRDKEMEDSLMKEIRSILADE